MSLMTDLAKAIQTSSCIIPFEDDLPLPNLYFSSVYRHTGETYHVYLVADYTGSALEKLHVWCQQNHDFRPYRSNSKVMFRRLKLGDLVENPDAFDQAMTLAIANHETAAVAALDKLPAWIAAVCGVELPKTPARSLLQRLGGWVA